VLTYGTFAIAIYLLCRYKKGREYGQKCVVVMIGTISSSIIQSKTISGTAQKIAKMMLKFQGKTNCICCCVEYENNLLLVYRYKLIYS
jgi:H+/gluconate symporter-like permease